MNQLQDDDDRDAWKGHLLHEMHETELSILALDRALEPVESACGIGRISATDSLPDRPATEEALRLARDRMAALMTAYSWTSEPDFGLCENCGQPISRERLAVVPETRLCVACKDRTTG